MARLNPFSLLILSLLFITTRLASQETVEAQGPNGSSYRFKVFHIRGDELNRHSVSLHLIGDETNSIALGYRGTYKYFIWSTELALIPTIYDEPFGYFSVDGCALLLRGLPRKKITFLDSDLGDGRYGSSRKVTLPVLASHVLGLHVGIRQVNLFSGAFSVRPNTSGQYPLTSLITPEVALGLYGHLSRYAKISSQSYSTPVQRTVFFAAKADLLLYPSLTFPANSSYPDLLAEKDSLLNYKLGLRLQLEGRLTPLKRLDWGFSWRAGVIRSALVDSMIKNYFAYVAIGTYIGWGEAKKTIIWEESVNH
jgi:hypothetical protein